MKISNINSQYNQNKNNNPSFTAAPKFVTDKLEKFYKQTAANDTFRKGIKNFSSSDKTFTHLLAAESAILSSFYMLCTLKNDKIEKEQKPQMLINDALTFSFSTAGAYLAEDKISNVINNKSEKYFENNKDFYINLGKKEQEKSKTTPLKELFDKTGEVFSKKGEDLKKGIEETKVLIGDHLTNLVKNKDEHKAYGITKEELSTVQDKVASSITKSQNKNELQEKIKSVVKNLYEAQAAREQADKTKSGINKLKVLVVFGFIYRFIGPVLFTPIANSLSSKFFPANKK